MTFTFRSVILIASVGASAFGIGAIASGEVVTVPAPPNGSVLVRQNSECLPFVCPIGTVASGLAEGLGDDPTTTVSCKITAAALDFNACHPFSPNSCGEIRPTGLNLKSLGVCKGTYTGVIVPGFPAGEKLCYVFYGKCLGTSVPAP